MHHFAIPRSACVAALLSILLLIDTSALAASKLQQFAVPADDGHALALWAREVARPKAVVLLIHGRTWSALPDFDLQVRGERRSVMQSLNEQGFSAYALDLRGYGKTPRDATGWLTPDRAARDVIATLEWLAQTKKGSRPVLLGWSMGSLVSQLAAQRRPQLISGLVLYGYPRDPDNPAPFQSVPAEPERIANTKEAAASDFISPEVVPPNVVAAYVVAALAADPVRVDWKNQEEFRELDPSKIGIPTLLLQGERDPLTPSGAQARLFTRLRTPDRQWIVLPEGGHAALLEDMHQAFIAAIAGFINRPRREPPE